MAEFQKMLNLKIISVAQHNIENKRSINVFQIFTTATFLENNSCIKLRGMRLPDVHLTRISLEGV